MSIDISGGHVGLTTTRAAFIEQAQQDGRLFIEQPYELYSSDNQRAWHLLYTRIQPMWEKYANARFLEGVKLLHLNPDTIPRLEEINRFLEPLSGFEAKPVSGYVAAYLFFDCLRQRRFPTTITIRDHSTLDYLPEPDVFHDIAGHVPMHTDRLFSDVLVRFGEVASFAAERAKAITSSKEEQGEILESNIRAMARFFWFTVEFGLIQEESGLKAYGSGLLSSRGELQHSIESPSVQRFPLQLEWVVNQGFEIDRYQPLLFVISSFDQLFSEVDHLEAALRGGELDHVAPGEPLVNAEDLRSFMDR